MNTAKNLRFILNKNYSITVRRTLFGTIQTSNTSIPTIKNVRDQMKERVGFSSVFSDESIDKTPLLSYKIKSQSDLPASRMTESYAEAIIPIGTEPSIRERYVTFHHRVRFGRLLEDLDTMAVHISYLHNRSQMVKLQSRQITPIVIVTALVDKIEVKTVDILIDKNLKISGFTSWVGRTSAETTMKLEQEISPNNWSHVLDAKFLVCARDASNKGSALVNPLKIETPQEKEIFDLGEKNKLLRHTESQQSLFNVPPSPEDSVVIHNLFKETIDLQSGSLQPRILPPNSVWMGDTILKNVQICQPEQRNIYNKIFGGYVMRKAFELAFANASVFTKSHAEVTVVDDISFKQPILIGSLFFLSSQVVQTLGNQVLVKVHGETLDKATGKHQTTNEFYFKFVAKDKAEVQKVIPKTYSEAMLYVDGRRHW